MPTPPETVTVAIDGKTHHQWSRYDIDSDLLVPADEFSVAAAPPSTLPSAVTPGSRVTVRVDGTVVLDGSVDRIETQTAKDGRTLTLSGRDRAGILLDCAAPLIAAEALDLAAIVERLVRPLGINKVRIDSAGSGTIAKVQIEPGIRVWDALIRYCEANGVWPWYTPDGTLVVGGPDYTAAPVADLILRTSGRGNNIETIAVSRAIDERYSAITLLGQSHDGRNAIQATVKDTGVTVNRPLVIVDPDIDSKAAAEHKARKRLADSRLAGFDMRIQVKGHRAAGGALWTPGQRVRVLSEPDGIDGIYFLIGRRFFCGKEQSPGTELRLKEDGTWVLDANPVKTAGKRRKQKSAKEQLVTI